MHKQFPGCHIEVAKNALAAWRYCGKEDTRVEGPCEHGVPPAALNQKGDKKARNLLIIEKGLIHAVEEGLIPIEKYQQARKSLDLFTIDKQTATHAEGVRGLWYYGPPGTGKSHNARLLEPDSTYIKAQNKWFDGYLG